jgi:hypothetical protein
MICDCMKCKAARYDAAIEHLGNVLYMLADLHPDDRCVALDNALKYYNESAPTKTVAPTGFVYERLVSEGLPWDRLK